MKAYRVIDASMPTLIVVARHILDVAEEHPNASSIEEISDNVEIDVSVVVDLDTPQE